MGRNGQTAAPAEAVTTGKSARKGSGRLRTGCVCAARLSPYLPTVNRSGYIPRASLFVHIRQTLRRPVVTGRHRSPFCPPSQLRQQGIVRTTSEQFPTALSSLWPLTDDGPYQSTSCARAL
uniref:Uncharacterized protein n=1 Tax=Plectus sambesii TaxID=2011161 RepID=A0A914WXJ5_9BILA